MGTTDRYCHSSAYKITVHYLVLFALTYPPVILFPDIFKSSTFACDKSSKALFVCNTNKSFRQYLI